MFFFFFKKQNVHTRKIKRSSEVLHARARPMGIGFKICPGLRNDRFNEKAAEVNVSFVSSHFVITVTLCETCQTQSKLLVISLRQNSEGRTSVKNSLVSPVSIFRYRVEETKHDQISFQVLYLGIHPNKSFKLIKYCLF